MYSSISTNLTVLVTLFFKRSTIVVQVGVRKSRDTKAEASREIWFTNSNDSRTVIKSKFTYVIIGEFYGSTFWARRYADDRRHVVLLNHTAV